MSTLLDQAPPAEDSTVRLLKKTGKLALEFSVRVGLAYLADPSGPNVITRLQAPKKIREALAPLVYNAVHVGVEKAGVQYPAGGLGVWVIVEAKGQLLRHAEVVIQRVATNVEQTVAHFLTTRKP